MQRLPLFLLALVGPLACYAQQCGSQVGGGTCGDIGFPDYCCSRAGWCGQSNLYCGDGCQHGPCEGAAPTPPPTTPPPTPPTPSPAHTAIAFLENWSACPTDDALSHYTHIMISFAVTYQWSPNGNICDQQCNLSPLMGCNNAPPAALVQQAHRLGVKVLLSVGGAGQGGSWDLSKNRCWDPCLDKADHLVSQIAAMVQQYNLDGVDVDYEDVLDTPERLNFLRDLTLGLRIALGPDQLLTHTPMDSALEPGLPYYDLLATDGLADSIDLLMPQYYNGFIKTVSQFPAASAHFAALSQLYNGDNSRIVFGFCINQCPGFNANAAQALSVLMQLDAAHPGNGGFFFWSHQKGDIDGSWSRVLLDYYASRGTLPPSPIPNPTPTTSPPTTNQPTTAPPTTLPPTNPFAPPTPAPTSPTSTPPTPTSGAGCANVAEWADAQAYVQGDVVQKGGMKYTAKWWTKGVDPTTSNEWGPWQTTGSCTPTSPPTYAPGACPLPEWVMGDVYVGGDEVVKGGVKYRAKWWNDGADPAVDNGSGKPWEDLGACVA